MRRSAALFLGLATACTPRPKPAPRAIRIGAAPDQAPHYHAYPEIPPDELAKGAADDAPRACSAFPTPAPRASPPERIRSGPPVTNYIPPEVIMKPIRERAACFRACYERGLRPTPSLSGRVVIRFVIDTDGWVRRARVEESEIVDEAVSECVREAFVGLRYPEPAGSANVTVVYPIEFRPE